MLDARHVVTSRIASEFKRFPDIDLKPLDVSMLDPREASLARAIDRAVHRRWISLTTVIGHASNRIVHKLDSQVGATLLVASSQLLLLDKIPDHAVINCAVEWVKNNGQPRATGFVNAVLRKITRLREELLERGSIGEPDQFLRSDGSAWRLSEPVFKDSVDYQTGFPRKSWKRLLNEFGEKRASQIAFSSIAEPPILLTAPSNTALPEELIQHEEPNFGVVPQGVNLTSLFSNHKSLRVQDPTSAKALSLIENLHPKRILDVCAGRGTKTKQLRSLFPNATIAATEPNDARREYLQELANEIDVIVYSQETDGPTEPFDLVIVDTPCSNSGVFSRRPEAKYRYDKKHIDSLVDLQQEILQDATSVLQNKGYLLYATCSIDAAENDKQVDWLTEKYQMKLVSDHSTFPSGFPGSEPSKWRDGGFVTLLKAR
jgi:16S rRNA (cytosine967-C5)-methyltransferase